MKQKNFYFYTNLLAWGLVFLLAGSYVFGWTTPSDDPPDSNLPAAINVSSTAQSKEGYLAIGTSTAPTIPLDVTGTANMTTLSIGGTAVTATASELNFIDGVTSAIQTQLNAKESTINAGTTAQYLRGDKTWQTLPSSEDTWITTQTCSTDYALQSVGKESKVCINKVDYSDVAYDVSCTNCLTSTEVASSDIAYDLSCTDCIGTTEIADSYVLNTSDTMSGTLTTGGTFTANTNSTDNYDKIRVYPSASYTIGMKSAQTYGGLGDWAMTFTMNNDADRGFLWRDVDDAVSDGAMSLTTAGVLKVKGTVTAPTFVGALSGNATTATTASDLSCTDCIGTTEIADSYVLNTGDAMTGALAMGANKITGLGAPTLDTDAANKAYVDSSDADTWITTQTCSTDYALQSVGKTTKTCINKVDYSDVAYDLSCTDCIGTTEIADSYVLNTGDAMTGALAMGNQKITGLATPTADTDAAAKKYVDDAVFASATCDGTVLKIKFTSSTYGGNLGGQSGADLLCNSEYPGYVFCTQTLIATYGAIGCLPNSDQYGTLKYGMVWTGVNTRYDCCGYTSDSTPSPNWLCHCDDTTYCTQQSLVNYWDHCGGAWCSSGSVSGMCNAEQYPRPLACCKE